MEKRYQRYTRNGIAWGGWYEAVGEPTRWQLKGKLLNEYRDEKGNIFTPKK